MIKSFIISILLLIFIKCDKESKALSPYFTLISTQKDFLLFMIQHKRFMLEIFSPSCGHCFAFKPKYEKAAIEMKDIMPFVQIDSANRNIFDKYFAYSGTPTMYYYENSKFYFYQGTYESQSLVNWANSLINWKCTQIKTVSELNSMLDIQSNKNNESFIIGVFTETESNNKLKFYLKINEQNKDHAKQCYYFLYDSFQLKDKLMHYIQLDVIYSYNMQRGINSFNLLQNIELNNQNSEALFDIASKYEQFLYHYYFGFSELVNQFNNEQIAKWDGQYLVMAYRTIDEKNNSEELFKMFINSNVYNYSTLGLFIDQLDYNKPEYIMLWNQHGVFIGNLELERGMKIDGITPEKPTQHSIELIDQKIKSEIQFYDYYMDRFKQSRKFDQINRFIKAGLYIEKVIKKPIETPNNQSNSTNNSNQNSSNNTNINKIPINTTDNSSNNNVSSPISIKQIIKEAEEKFETNNSLNQIGSNNNNNEEEIKPYFNTVIISIPIYLLIYTGIFYLIYKISNPNKIISL